MSEVGRGLDVLYREWQHAAAWARKFEGRPLDDPVRTKWVAEAAARLGALQDEERRLAFDPTARLHR